MIKNGSEKQTAWAETIVKRWRKKIETELDVQNDRINISKDGSVLGYRDELAKSLDMFDSAIDKIDVKSVIDLHTSKKNPAGMMIAQARSRYAQSRSAK